MVEMVEPHPKWKRIQNFIKSKRTTFSFGGYLFLSCIAGAICYIFSSQDQTLMLSIFAASVLSFSLIFPCFCGGFNKVAVDSLYYTCAVFAVILVFAYNTPEREHSKVAIQIASSIEERSKLESLFDPLRKIDDIDPHDFGMANEAKRRIILQEVAKRFYEFELKQQAIYQEIRCQELQRKAIEDPYDFYSFDRENVAECQRRHLSLILEIRNIRISNDRNIDIESLKRKIDQNDLDVQIFEMTLQAGDWIQIAEIFSDGNWLERIELLLKRNTSQLEELRRREQEIENATRKKIEVQAALLVEWYWPFAVIILLGAKIGALNLLGIAAKHSVIVVLIVFVLGALFVNWSNIELVERLATPDP